jgi:predicted outer membrane protein
MRKLLPSLLCAAIALALPVHSFAAETARPMASGDKKFVKDAGDAMIGVLHLTELVIRDTSPGGDEIKTASKPLSTDLNTAWGELGTIAQGKGTEMPKTDATGTEKHALEQLKKSPTDKFDKAYLKDLTKETKKLARVTNEGAKQLQDAELKAWAEKWAPGFKAHDEKVAALEKSEGKKK